MRVCVIVLSVITARASGQNNTFDRITSFKRLEQLQYFSSGSLLGMTCEMMTCRRCAALPRRAEIEFVHFSSQPSLVTSSLASPPRTRQRPVCFPLNQIHDSENNHSGVFLKRKASLSLLGVFVMR